MRTKSSTMWVIVRIDKATDRRSQVGDKCWATLRGAQPRYDLLTQRNSKKYNYELVELPRTSAENAHLRHMMIKYNKEWR